MTNRARVLNWLHECGPATARDAAAALGLDPGTVDADIRAMSKDGRTKPAGRSERRHPSGAIQHVRLWVSTRPASGGGTAPRVVVPGPLVAPQNRKPDALHAAWWPRAGQGEGAAA